MNEEPIPVRPISTGDQFLMDKFTEAIVNQSTQMDKLGHLLITMELAIPGIYAAVLKLLKGNEAALLNSKNLYISFICWFAALLITLISLIPKKWTVYRNILRQSSNETDELSIEGFFYKSAQYKRRLLLISSILFFVGVCFAAFAIF